MEEKLEENASEKRKGKNRRPGLVCLGGLLLAGGIFLLVSLGGKAPVSQEGEGEAVEIVMESVIYGENLPDLPLVEEALNAITLPKIGVRVRLLPVSIDDHETRINQMLRQGKKLDLVNTGRTTPLSELVGDGHLLPLNELLDTYAGQLKEKAGDLLEANRFSGSLYAVPASLYCGSQPGFFYNAALAEELGLEIPERVDIPCLEELARALREEKIYLYTAGSAGGAQDFFHYLYPQLLPTDGGVYTCGSYCLLEGSYELQNAFTTREFLDFCQRMRSWKVEGYFPPDTLVGGGSSLDMFLEGSVFLLRIPVNPVEYALMQKNIPFPLGVMTTQDPSLSTSEIQENGWGISSGCDHPEAAMKLLNLIYTDGEVANLLMNGIEGRQYVKVSEHIIREVEGREGETGYQRDFSVFGDFRQIFQWEPATEAFYQELEDFYGNIALAPYLGYTFDVSEVPQEYLAVTQVLDSYLPALECGLIEDVKGAVDSLNERLREAGIDTLLESNRKQLQSWRERKENDLQ